MPENRRLDGVCGFWCMRRVARGRKVSQEVADLITAFIWVYWTSVWQLWLLIWQLRRLRHLKMVSQTWEQTVCWRFQVSTARTQCISALFDVCDMSQEVVGVPNWRRAVDAIVFWFFTGVFGGCDWMRTVATWRKGRKMIIDAGHVGTRLQDITTWTDLHISYGWEPTLRMTKTKSGLASILKVDHILRKFTTMKDQVEHIA